MIFKYFRFVENTSRVAMVHALKASILWARILKWMLDVFACRWLVNASGSMANVWDGSKKIRSPHLHKTAGLGKLSRLSKLSQLEEKALWHGEIGAMSATVSGYGCSGQRMRNAAAQICFVARGHFLSQEKCGLYKLIKMARVHSISSMDASHQPSARQYVYIYN